MINWSTANAWREILARIFEGFDERNNFSPNWMINPVTGRRLKLDRYYPELGVAFRLLGLQGRQNYRLSEDEAKQEEERNNMREYLCRQQGVTLVQLDVNEEEPWRLVERVRGALGRTSRLLLQSDVEGKVKQDLAPRIAAARRRADDVLAQVRKPEGLKLYADLWQDREYRSAAPPAREPADAAPVMRRYKLGMLVEHATLGPGVVSKVDEGEKDYTVTVRFADGAERTFLMELVADKLLPQ